jgi:MIP family channel proteins
MTGNAVLIVGSSGPLCHPSFCGFVTSDRTSRLGGVTDPLRRSVAEFIGTFTLVFIGAGSIMTAAGLRDPTLIGIALAHGLAIGVMVSAVGHISGGHFNPAVTLGFLVTRRIEALLAVYYWLAQFAAAIVASLLLWWIFPTSLVDARHLGVPALGSGIGSGAGLAVEVILTFFLVWVVFATAADPRGTFKSIAGLAIGFTITLDILMGGPLTGAAMNPARALGPQLVHDDWANGWIWYLGPALGAVAAALLYEWLYLRPLAPVPVGPPETGVLEPRPGETAAS